jgi:hypothetical protein
MFIQKVMDLVIYNGNILTMTDKRAHAVSVDNGRIRSLQKSEAKEEIDLDGKTLIPGFIDSHCHFISLGLKLYNVDLSNAKNVQHAVNLLEERASKTEKGKWVRGYSWDESFWDEKRYLTPDDVSGIEHPVCAIRVDGHMAVINEAAQKKLGVQKGYLYEDELFHLQSAVSDNDIENAFKAALQVASQQGVTSIHDNPMSIKSFHLYQRMKWDTLRIYVNLPVSVLDAVTQLQLRSGFGNEWLKVGGIKIFTDGSIGAKTAAVSFNYKNEENNGLLVYSDEELRSILKRAHPNQTAVHAIGDRAIQQVIDCSQVGVRNRIEHAELLTDGQIQQIKELGLILSMQPNFLQWSHPGGLYDSRFGTGIDNRFATLKKAKIPMVFGSDCMPFSPLYGIQQVVNAPFEEQKLSVMDALNMYTEYGAYASFEEDIKGTIEEGKLADFVVLSGDPREEDISRITVDMTIVGGKVVYG